jgi:cytochrome P450
MTDSVSALPDWPMPRSSPLLPPDAYTEFRAGPPRKVQLRDGTAWLITRYADVRAALLDQRLSSDDQQPNFPLRIQLPPDPRIQSFFRMDQPEQGRLRRMAMTEFTARRARLMRPAVEQLVADLLDELAMRPQPTDLIGAFTLKLPSLVIARLLGVPDADEKSFTAQSRMILSQQATREETYGETTANQLSLSVLSLLQHPEQLAGLRRDPHMMEPAIEELLRYWSISQDNIVRVAIDALELGDARIRDGDPVVIALNGANHDERVFPGAATLDIGRDARHHVAFGYGPHLCPGAPLARLELKVGLSELFRRGPAG